MVLALGGPLESLLGRLEDLLGRVEASLARLGALLGLTSSGGMSTRPGEFLGQMSPTARASTGQHL